MMIGPNWLHGNGIYGGGIGSTAFCRIKSGCRMSHVVAGKFGAIFHFFPTKVEIWHVAEIEPSLPHWKFMLTSFVRLQIIFSKLIFMLCERL